MSMSKSEVAAWITYGKRYDANDNCLNCGENFYAAHQPTCRWSDDCNSLNIVLCGDCLRSDCNGCKY
jgi:hypothetical protein